jgi:type I restriction enzyme S subunit
MGQSPDSSSYNNNKDGLYLIQGNADIKLRKTAPRTWTNQPTKKCKYGDIIMTVRAPVGAIAMSLHDACIGRGVCSIRNNCENNLSYLYQFLLSFEKKWIRFEQGSTFTAVNSKDVKNLKVNIPFIEEQQKIAKFLSSIDKKIEQITNQVTQTKQYKKALLQQMFV